MYLLDTNHCSALIFNEPNVVNRAKAVGNDNLAISIITEGELLYRVENSERVEENRAVIYEFLEDISIYDIDSGTSRIYAKLKAKIMNEFAPKERNKRRKTKITELGIGENDLWIAASAIYNNLVVVSADRDFKRIQKAWDFSLEAWYPAVSNLYTET
jgi:tRNA(fMet)-specific endonuclease VapC